MTGFASVTLDAAAGRITVEMRSVNSRFLDLAFRMPDELRSAEIGLREAIGARVQRGKIDCRVALQPHRSDFRQPALDDGLVAALVNLGERIGRQAPRAAPLSQADLLRWPGVITEPVHDPEQLIADVVSAGRGAVAALIESRAREGERLATIVRGNAQAIAAIVAELRSRAPALLAQFQARALERLQALVGQATPQGTIGPDEVMARVRQEVALHGMRIDVAEEIDRLQTHLIELERALSGPGPMGKRLDFLLQEFNREANTLGSKTAGIDIPQSVIELKLAIERIREQVQNIE